MKQVISILLIGAISMMLGAMKPIKTQATKVENSTTYKIDSLREEPHKLIDSIQMDIDSFKLEINKVEKVAEKMLYQLDTLNVDTFTVQQDTTQVVKKKKGWFKKIVDKINGKN